MTGKMKVDIWSTSTEKGNFYMSDLCTTVLPYCAPCSSSILPHYISEDETFSYHTLMGGILIIIMLLSPTVMLTTFHISSLGEVLLFMNLIFSSEHPYLYKNKVGGSSLGTTTMT